VLRREVLDAVRVLGVPEANFQMFDFRVRHFPAVRQDILEVLVAMRRTIEPDLVVLPSPTDIHQDHGTLATEGIRAFKHSTVLGYELPMNTITFVHACFVELEPRHLDVKVRHAAVYESQRSRPYMRAEFIRSLAVVRGLQMDVDAAEAFEVIRLMVPH
jgi:LmbE family N-acetylglucosaminyl deacetylase